VSLLSPSLAADCPIQEEKDLLDEEAESGSMVVLLLALAAPHLEL